MYLSDKLYKVTYTVDGDRLTGFISAKDESSLGKQLSYAASRLFENDKNKPRIGIVNATPLDVTCDQSKVIYLPHFPANISGNPLDLVETKPDYVLSPVYLLHLNSNDTPRALVACQNIDDLEELVNAPLRTKPIYLGVNAGKDLVLSKF